MKKRFNFILILIVVFACLYTKLNDDSHVIPINSSFADVVNENDSKTENDINDTKVFKYKFSKKPVELPKDIKEAADKISKDYDAVGVQIAVMKNHELLYTYEYGHSNLESGKLLTSDNKYRVASLAKFVTDAVFMKLCELGKVSVDGDISDYLGFEARNPYYPDVVITPAMLMSHCGTIVDSVTFDNSLYNNSSLTIKDVLLAPGTFCQAEPGEFYSYSNFSVAVIGAICENVTGKYFYELAEDYFFDPLDIDASYLASELKNTDLIANIYGGGVLTASTQLSARFHPTIGQTHHIVQGNLISSAKDYMKFIAMIAAGGVTEKGKRLLSEDSINEMLKSRIYDAYGLGSGFGCEENKTLMKNRTLYTHTGDAYGMYSSYVFDPETGDGITILTSGAGATYLDAQGIYDICFDYMKIMFPQ